MSHDPGPYTPELDPDYDTLPLPPLPSDVGNESTQTVTHPPTPPPPPELSDDDEIESNTIMSGDRTSSGVPPRNGVHTHASVPPSNHSPVTPTETTPSSNSSAISNSTQLTSVFATSSSPPLSLATSSNSARATPMTLRPMPLSSQRRTLSLSIRSVQVRDGVAYYELHVEGTVGTKPFHDVVFQRFSDFFSLDETLRKQFPFTDLPMLPPKRLFGNLSAEFLEQRRLALHGYMSQLDVPAMLPHSEALRQFLPQVPAVFSSSDASSSRKSGGHPISRFGTFMPGRSSTESSSHSATSSSSVSPPSQHFQSAGGHLSSEVSDDIVWYEAEENPSSFPPSLLASSQSTTSTHQQSQVQVSVRLGLRSSHDALLLHSLVRGSGATGVLRRIEESLPYTECTLETSTTSNSRVATLVVANTSSSQSTTTPSPNLSSSPTLRRTLTFSSPEDLLRFSKHFEALATSATSRLTISSSSSPSSLPSSSSSSSASVTHSPSSSSSLVPDPSGTWQSSHRGPSQSMVGSSNGRTSQPLPPIALKALKIMTKNLSSGKPTTSDKHSQDAGEYVSEEMGTRPTKGPVGRTAEGADGNNAPPFNGAVLMNDVSQPGKGSTLHSSPSLTSRGHDSLVSHLKSMQYEIYTTTWNCGNAPMQPGVADLDWLPSRELAEMRLAVIVVSLQECTQNITAIGEVLSKHFGPKFTLVEKKAMWDVKMLVWVKTSLLQTDTTTASTSTLYSSSPSLSSSSSSTSSSSSSSASPSTQQSISAAHTINSLSFDYNSLSYTTTGATRSRGPSSSPLSSLYTDQTTSSSSIPSPQSESTTLGIAKHSAMSANSATSTTLNTPSQSIPMTDPIMHPGGQSGPGSGYRGPHDQERVPVSPARQSLVVSGIESSSIATGIMGILGNKGAVALKLRLHGTTILFVNSHLAPHEVCQLDFDPDNHLHI